MNLETPVLLLIFNRLDTAKKVFEQIRQAKPKQLFIAADGPREFVAEDAFKCEAVRKMILESVDWPCEVKTLFRQTNLGCGIAPAKAITWFFEHVEEGIILEDDCLPDISFFFFCQELLEYYRNDIRIMHISGNNFQYGKTRGNASYYFSIYNHSWGWATWRRCWAKYDFLMSDFDVSNLQHSIAEWKLDQVEIEYWINNLKKVYLERPRDVWDYQWTYTIWKNKGLCILPSENLIMNIGFAKDATHTKNATERLQKIKLHKLEKEIVHPREIAVSRVADKFTFETHFMKKDKWWRSFKNNLLQIPFVKKMYTIVKPTILTTDS